MHDAPTTPAEPRWHQDPWLWTALLAALLARYVPMWLWGVRNCTFDECSYKVLARAIVAGEGFNAHEGWLWAPGYPYLVALFEAAGDVYRVKRLQVILALITAVFLYQLARRLFGLRVGRSAAWLFAVHPTLAWFAGTMYSESVYAFLLVTATMATLWARDGRAARGVVPGVVLAACVLSRGVATPLAPVFALALLWPVEESWGAALRARWAHAFALLAVCVTLVAPWSVHASRAHGGLVIADATMGQVMYLGNNDFPVPTYDYGIGLLNDRLSRRYQSKGRPHCPRSLPTARWNSCEVRNGVEWIAAHPGAFVARVPVRWAQLLNPNSFLTRHIRTSKWPGLPWWLKEVTCVAIALAGAGVVVLGTVGAWARVRGPFGALSVGVVAYHLVAIGCLFGMSRFRVPLDHLWLVYAALVVADPRGVARDLAASPGRLAGCVATLVVVVPLVAWFAPTGFPSWWR